MITCVVNLHGGLEGLHLTSPLFYPLLRSGAYREFSGSLDALSDVRDQVRFQLEDEPDIRVRFIFLLNMDERTGSEWILRDALAPRLAELVHVFLADFAGLGYELEKPLVLVVDSVARDPRTGKPGDRGACHGWELDKDGRTVTPSRYPFIFSENELTTLDEEWGSGLAVAGTCRVDAGVRSLGEECREQLADRSAKFKKSLQSLVDEKTGELSGVAGVAKEYLRPDVLASIRDEVFTEIDDLFHGENVIPLLQLRPSRLVGEVLSRNLGIRRFTERLTLVRFHLPDSPLTSYRTALVGLAYLLLFFIENKDQPRGHGGKQVLSATVELNPEVLARHYRCYATGLERGAESLDAAARERLRGTFIEHEAGSCAFSDPLIGPVPVDLPHDVRFGLFFASTDLDRWRNLRTRTVDALGQGAGEVKKRVEEYARRLRSGKKRTIPAKSDDLERTVEDLRRKYEECRAGAREKRRPERPLDWGKMFARETKGFEAWHARRPTFPQALLVFFVGVLCLAVSFAAGGTRNFGQALPETLPVPLALLAAAILAVVWCLFSYRNKLGRAVKDLVRRAEEVQATLMENLAKGQDLLGDLCTLDMTGRTLKSAELSLAAAAGERSEITHHLRKLLDHRENAGLMQEYLARPLEEGDIASNPPLVETSRPAFMNEIYWPFWGTDAKQRVTVYFGTREETCSSPNLQGLDGIRFHFEDMSSFGAGPEYQGIRQS